jgi:hypothetical protein
MTQAAVRRHRVRNDLRDSFLHRQLCDKMSRRCILGLFLCGTQMLEFPYTLIALGKGLASWFLPFMVIIFVTFWKQEQGPWTLTSWWKTGKRGPRAR